MTTRVFRYQVPVDDKLLAYSLTGDPLHVEADRTDTGVHVVDFWAEHTDDRPASPRVFQVFGTGHPLPDGARYWGTTARTPEGLVWHLYELPATRQAMRKDQP